MAAHLRRSIHGFVGANKFSFPSNPLLASSIPMGARFFSSTPISPVQSMSFKEKPSGVLIGGVGSIFLYGIDFLDWRTEDKAFENAITRKRLEYAEALLEDVQRKIDTLKVKPYERVYTDDNVPQAGHAKSGE